MGNWSTYLESLRGQTVESEIGFCHWMLGRDFAESTKDVLRGELNRLGL